MLSFIKKIFESRRRKIAERERLCHDLFQQVTMVLLDYFDLNKECKDSLNRWISDSEKLLFVFELNGISQFKKCSDYKALELQIEKLRVYRTKAFDAVLALDVKEKQKRADEEYVSDKLKQWAFENKQKNIGTSESKSLNRKLKKLDCKEKPSFENEKCSCCDKNGRKKLLYLTEGEALVVADYRSNIIGFPLRVYSCPYGKGFHITSNLF